MLYARSDRLTDMPITVHELEYPSLDGIASVQRRARVPVSGTVPDSSAVDTYSDLLRLTQTCSDLLRLTHTYPYVLIRTHMYSYVLICTHTYSYLLKLTHTYSYVLIHTHTYSWFGEILSPNTQAKSKL